MTMTMNKMVKVAAIFAAGVLLMGETTAGFVPAAAPMRTIIPSPLIAEPKTVAFLQRGRQEQESSSSSSTTKSFWGFSQTNSKRSLDSQNSRSAHKGDSADHDPPSPSGRDDAHTESQENENHPENEVLSKRGGYQRAEDWDAEQKAIAQELTWEQRVQFDGQRFGDQMAQNTILNRHLSSF